MLAVVHHLLIGDQIPLGRIAALCHSLTSRSLIVAWVPSTDPKFNQLLRGRDSLYAGLTEVAFRTAFAQHFQLVSEKALTNGRIICLFEKV
jgi:hypothetical protein